MFLFPRYFPSMGRPGGVDFCFWSVCFFAFGLVFFGREIVGGARGEVFYGKIFKRLHFVFTSHLQTVVFCFAL